MKKVAIITGASGGIGAAVARILAPDHAVVAGYHRNREAAEALAKALTAECGTVAAFGLDVVSEKEAVALVTFACETYGGVDVLVNCAGVSLFSLTQDTTDAQYAALMDVNMKGVFHTCRAVLPTMLEKKAGSIVNVSSMWGLAGASCEAVYSASKAAVIGFTKALAKEVAPSGIAVNCVAPGLIDTDMNRSLTEQEIQAFVAETPLARIGTPEEVARAVRYFVDSNFTTGQVLSPNGGVVI